MSVNKVILLGRLGKDPEVRFTGAGQPVASFSLATNDAWTDKSGQKQERTEWHNIVVWGKLAELCKEYLAKGREVYIEGRIQTRKWQDKEGKTRYNTDIVANTVQFLGGGRGGAGQQGGDSQEPDRGGEPPSGGDIPPQSGFGGDDEIPF